MGFCQAGIWDAEKFIYDMSFQSEGWPALYPFPVKRVLDAGGALDFPEQQEPPLLEATGGAWGFLEQQLVPLGVAPSGTGVGEKRLVEFIVEREPFRSEW